VSIARDREQVHERREAPDERRELGLEAALLAAVRDADPFDERRGREERVEIDGREFTLTQRRPPGVLPLG
jgi:hypothetical protein